MGFKVLNNVIAEDSAFEDNPEIQKYLSEFQVNLRNEDKHIDCDLSSSAGSEMFISSRVTNNNKVSSITVFKMKNLKKLGLDHSQRNIYEHNLSQPDLEKDDPRKSKVSCIRCRKFKKRCSRALPECSNCSSSDDLCVYLPRKIKAKRGKNGNSSSIKVNVENKLDAMSASSNITRNVGVKLGTEIDSVKKRLSLPNLLNYSSSEGRCQLGNTENKISMIRLETSESNSSILESKDSTSNYSYESKSVIKHSNDFSVILN
ncbi:hypothetical protein DFJ63DRAFT_221892 [Scheffersomyces coipomensis]|uniref:uncharacterized protein n=1 Tax=Scheffersomyces coipomensis TaxID=1788519 RepID=UPI00315DF92A